jgi:hypothetical protein
MVNVAKVQQPNEMMIDMAMAQSRQQRETASSLRTAALIEAWPVPSSKMSRNHSTVSRHSGGLSTNSKPT